MVTDRYYGVSPSIAKWKLDNRFENLLGSNADRSEFWKTVYVTYYKVFDNRYYRGGLRYIDTIIKEQYGLETISDTIVKDMIYCLHRFGISFEDYCKYDFRNNRSVAYRDSFVSDKLRYHYCDILNSPDIRPLMTDKYACYQKFRRFFKREMIGCHSAGDRDIFTGFISRHPSFIYKPSHEHSGNGIEIVRSADICPDEFFSSRIAAGAFVLEELIVQGEGTARMHPQSVNSCRIVTFNLNDNITIIGAAWRIGTGSSIKDNAGAGGIYAAINPETGIIETAARDFKGDCFGIHPDTGIRFEGYQLPEWDEAIGLIREMAVNVKGATLISWDIAFSDKGWVMVEANDNGGWSIIQSNKMKGRKADLYSLMDRYFNQ